ncbi:MAG: sugar phosphate isomerase/epimerase [Armatimonadetes bacterium]|nr:sugar phosphate isomerase/epimerase [Armatimonadota bacterium]
MKKAIVIRAFSENPDFLGRADWLASEEDFLRCFDKAVEAGFEGVQLFIDREGYFSLASDLKVAERIAAGAQRAGVSLASLEIAPFSYSLTDDDPTVREEGCKTIARAMEVAAAMGVRGVLVIPGWVGLPWNPAAKTVRYDIAYERTRDGLKAVAPTAERLGVSANLEPIWNRFLLSPLEVRGLLDEVGSEGVGLLLDTGNLIQFGYPEQWIRILGPRIKDVHFKDFRQSVGTVDGFVNLLEGDVNWPEVMAALREIHYDGFVIAEMFPYKFYGDTILKHTSVSMDRILGR